MKTGSPPTPLKARTGEFTPPGKRPLARASSRRDFSVFRDDMAGRDLAPLRAPVKRHASELGWATAASDRSGLPRIIRHRAKQSLSLPPVCGVLTPPARRWGCGCGHAKNRALAA